MTLHYYLHGDNGKTASILLSVSHKGKRYRYSLGISVDSRKWSKKKEKSGNVQTDAYLSRIRNEIEVNTSAMSTCVEVDQAVRRALHLSGDVYQGGGGFWDYFKGWVEGGTPARKAVGGAAMRLMAKLMGTQDNWKDIDLTWHTTLMERMDERGYRTNYKDTVTRNLRAVVKAGYNEGLYPYADGWKSFKSKNESIEAVYLTKDELERLWGLELTKVDARVRDLFFLGVYSAARFSDYSRFTTDNIRNGNLEFVQKKTNEKVVIPCSPRIITILERNGGAAPKVSLWQVNRYIKRICEQAGITEPMDIVRHQGGGKVVVHTRRCDLVSSHTARRTGATLLYLSGVPVRLCRFLTGHTTDDMFMRYIQVRKEEVADKLRDNPFFK